MQKKITAAIALSTILLSINANAETQQYQYQQPQQQQTQTYQPPQPVTGSQPQSSYGPPAYYPTYPTYPAYPGGYLAPGPVDPGEDEADRIYEENQHAPR